MLALQLEGCALLRFGFGSWKLAVSKRQTQQSMQSARGRAARRLWDLQCAASAAIALQAWKARVTTRTLARRAGIQAAVLVLQLGSHALLKKAFNGWTFALPAPIQPKQAEMRHHMLPRSRGVVNPGLVVKEREAMAEDVLLRTSYNGWRLLTSLRLLHGLEATGRAKTGEVLHGHKKQQLLQKVTLAWHGCAVSGRRTRRAEELLLSAADVVQARERRAVGRKVLSVWHKHALQEALLAAYLAKFVFHAWRTICSLTRSEVALALYKSRAASLLFRAWTVPKLSDLCLAWHQQVLKRKAAAPELLLHLLSRLREKVLQLRILAHWRERTRLFQTLQHSWAFVHRLGRARLLKCMVRMWRLDTALHQKLQRSSLASPLRAQLGHTEQLVIIKAWWGLAQRLRSRRRLRDRAEPLQANAAVVLYSAASRLRAMALRAKLLARRKGQKAPRDLLVADALCNGALLGVVFSFWAAEAHLPAVGAREEGAPRRGLALAAASMQALARSKKQLVSLLSDSQQARLQLEERLKHLQCSDISKGAGQGIALSE